MTTLQQAGRAGEHLISTVGQISNDIVDLAAGAALPAGQVLAYDSVQQLYVPYDNASATAGVAVAVLYAPAPARTEVTRVVVTGRLAEVQGSLLTGLDANARADFGSLFIVVR